MSKENQVIAPVLSTQPDSIEEIKQHADILEVISEYVALKQRGQEYVGLCPFHDEKTPSFSVSQSKQLYYCFGCGAAGDVIKFLMELGGHSFTDVVLDLAQRYSVPIDGKLTRSRCTPLPYPKPKKPIQKIYESESRKSEQVKDHTVNYAYVERSHSRLTQHQGEVQRLALSWLSGRGFSQEMIQHYQLGLEEVRAKNPESGAWESYWGIAIFIPVPSRPDRFYKKVRVAPWMDGNARPDYLRRWHQTGVPTTVFTTYQPDDANGTYFCEGEWDAIALGWEARQAGANVAIACSTGGCGTLPKPEQLEPLSKPVIIFYDRNDRPNSKTGVRSGECGAQRLAAALEGYGFVGQVPMPDDCTVEGWDVSDALAAGYHWSDFEAAATKALEGCSAIVPYAYKREEWDKEHPAGDEWQKFPTSSHTGSGGKNRSFIRPGRKEVKDFCQIAINDIFNDGPWIFVRHAFWRWVGTHYEPVAIEVVVKKIAQYCDSYAVPTLDKNTGETVWWYKYAHPRHVEAILKWAKEHLSIDPALVNPPGLNCVDGVLQLSYDPDSNKWIRNLVPHNPQYYYLYPPQATYNIPAVIKPDACDQLLSCLDAPQREIFLKIVAASLDLNTVRIYKGREIKALLMLGLGNNGKDTLRETTAMMFGHRGMVGASLSDFKQYDEGRKFPLAKLDGALINWPSENADCMLLDRLQSIKIAITGDPLSAEKKGRDEYQFNPKCTHFFNVNSLPHLLGAIEAIASRFAILNFSKTYKSNPGPGELKADPRFLYDKEFVRTEVLPWYLHRVLDALDRLMVEGIDYSCTSTAFEKAREEGDHVYSFCREVGIDYLPNGQITATDAYLRLRQWYIDNGTLEVKNLGDGRTKDIWNTQTTWGDHTVKGLNQILPRLLKLFPKATRTRDRLGRNCLEGIGFVPPSGSGGGGGDSGGDGQPQNSHWGNSVSLTNNSEAVLNVSEAVLNHPYPSSSKGFESHEADTAISRVKNLWAILTESERSQLLKEWGVEKNSGVNHSNQLQLVQNPDTASDTVSSEDVQTASEQVQSLPTVQELANQILLCESWVAAVNICQCDGASLKAAVESMKDDKQQHLTVLMVQHLVQIDSEQLATEWRC